MILKALPVESFRESNVTSLNPNGITGETPAPQFKDVFAHIGMHPVVNGYKVGKLPSTFNLQLSTFNLQPSTFNLQLSTFNLLTNSLFPIAMVVAVRNSGPRPLQLFS